MTSKNGISYLRWCRYFGNCGGGTPPAPDVETLIAGTPVNVQVAGIQVPFATIVSPIAGQHFIVRRSGVMKSSAYNWTKAPRVSIGTAAPWTNVQANSNLLTTSGRGVSETEPELDAFADGTTFLLSINVSGGNAANNAHVYPYLIGYWKTITPCV